MPDWQSGLCVCAGSPEVCGLALCCPCVVFGLDMEMLARPTECALGGSCAGAAAVWVGFGMVGLCCLPQCLGRGAIRDKHGIEGGLVSDCLETTFCGCCALVQEYNEVHTHATFGSNRVLPAAPHMACNKSG